MTLEVGARRVANSDAAAAISLTSPNRRRVQLRPLDWDTTFFGYKMGRLVATDTADRDSAPAFRQRLLEQDLRAVLEEASAASYAHLLLPVAADDLVLAAAVSASGLRLVDVSIDSSLSFERRAAPTPTADAYRIRAARAIDLSAVRELAGTAFALSRFSADPFFSAEQVEGLYRQWITNIFEDTAQAVLVYDLGGQVAGFVSCAIDGPVGRIPLIAAHAANRQRGVGRALVGAALRWFAAAGAEVARVKTQAANYPALALYHRSGFTVTSAELTFSITLRPQPTIQAHPPRSNQ